MRKKHIYLLLIIYLAFIALGLPDALLGSSWNLVRIDLNTSLSALGSVTIIVYVASMISTFNAPRLLRYVSTKKIVFTSILITAVSLLSISQIQHFYQMIFFALPLGIGAGAIDVSLNHYLVVNYKAKHMNYLHSFYGLGVTIGPTIMALTLAQGSWRLGYSIVGLILLIIAIFVLLSFSLWKEDTATNQTDQHKPIKLKEVFKIKGAFLSVMIFLVYVHIESLLGVWIASYVFIEKGFTYAVAAVFTSVYFLMFTLGRFISGYLSSKISSKRLILIGEMLILVSAILILFEYKNTNLYFVWVGMFGLGAAPVFPNMMYLNKSFFESHKLSKIMSLQMAIGYIGFGLLTPLAGLIFDLIAIAIFPLYIMIVGIILFALTAYYLRKKTEVLSHPIL
jgi:fucose permease